MVVLDGLKLTAKAIEDALLIRVLFVLPQFGSRFRQVRLELLDLLWVVDDLLVLNSHEILG